VIFIPPGVVHGYRAQRDVTIYNCFFRAELSEFELLWASRDDALMTLFGRGPARSGRPADHIVAQLDGDTLDACIAELDAIKLQGAGQGSHAKELGHLLLVLDMVARHGRLRAPLARESKPGTPRVVTASLELIESDLARHWTLADLSHEVFVGSFHLAHEFKRWVGTGPVAYANQLRAEQAAILLSGTDDSIGAIGRTVGWPEPSAFSRRFRQAFGVGPREYRRHLDDRSRT
jgi:AraC-like DNA-binding protein